MKILLLVLDGLGDRGKTPLEMARKPNMNSLLQNGQCGILDIGFGNRVESDFGYLHLLSSYSKKDYPGRGYLEALGIGLKPGPKDICIRGDFATLDKEGNIKDRRAGREEKGLEELCNALSMEIENVEITVHKSRGHRAVVIFRGNGLSRFVKGNDPLRVGVPVPQCLPTKPEGKKTASMVNMFLYRTGKILSKHPVNKKRKNPANMLLLRQPGMETKTKTFQERFSLKSSCIAGIPIAKGVARFLGMDVLGVPGATGDHKTNLRGKFNKALGALEKYDFLFLHINGTDILSHDAKPKEKKGFIEKIDSELGLFLKKAPQDLVKIITCDHRTVSSPSFKAYRHVKDPVPFLISSPKIKKGFCKEFSERSCERGDLEIKGNQLIPLVLSMIE